MARTRRPLSWSKVRPSGSDFQITFYHPVTRKAVRFNLGPAAVAQHHLEELNRIFLEPAYWQAPPDTLSQHVRDEWGGKDTGEILIKTPHVIEGEILTTKEAQKLRARIAVLEFENAALCKKVEARTGRKPRSVISPALSTAADTWKATYKGRDSVHTKIVGYDLDRFVKHFGACTVEEMEGREGDIDKWLRGLTVWVRKDGVWVNTNRPIGAGRRAQIRRHVLRFLADSGATLNRKQVASVSRKAVRAGRGQIRWLEKAQALAVANALAGTAKDPLYWQDMFRVQVTLGLRPDELPTLKAADFGPDYATLTLSRFDHLTLKQGSRSMKVPAAIRPIFKRRLEAGPVVFPDINHGGAWRVVSFFNKCYRDALKAAGKTAGVPFKMDCRVGRRTCASLLLRAGQSVSAVAALLGDDPQTIKEHYAAIMPHEVDSTAAALVDEPIAPKPGQKPPKRRGGRPASGR